MTNRLYHSDRTYDFQAEAVARLYAGGSAMVVYDCGLGKTHVAMNLAAMLFEDGKIDLVLVCAEKSKIRDWVEEFKQFTDLRPLLHRGTDRAKRWDTQQPQVLVTTYETAKLDFVEFIQPKRTKVAADGKLMDRIKTKRVLVIYDEIAKLRNRTGNKMYAAHAHILKTLREHGSALVVGLTATPIERDWENAFNELRLIRPDAMPKVKDFETHILSRNQYGKPLYRGSVIEEFAPLCRPLLIRKRKTDPDVVEQFPEITEESSYVELEADHRKLYRIIEDLAWDAEGNYQEIPGMWTVLRQTAGHPAAITRSTGALATMLVEVLGADWLRSIRSAKTEALIDRLRTVVDGEGSKAAVFTWFGQSVLPEVNGALLAEGFRVWTHHGGMSEREMYEAREAFRACPEPCVLLSSDAGAKGINLPEVTHVIEYESALNHATRTQRINRASRIGQGAARVNCMTFIAENTVEDGIIEMMLNTNAQQDQLLGDMADAGESWLSAGDRRAMFAMARKRA